MEDDVRDDRGPVESLAVDLKQDAWWGPGRILMGRSGLDVVSSVPLGTRRPIRVPPGEVTLVIPYLSLPWLRVALQLGHGDAAVVPFWKRSQLERMLLGAGSTPRVRRTLVRLAPRRSGARRLSP